MIKAMITSKKQDWETPRDLFYKLNVVFQFTLDPCATKENAKCKKFYTINENGLSQPWINETVFMNPPYNNIKAWMQKAYHEWRLNGVTSVCLIPARTDVAWWHDFVQDKATRVLFIRGRLKFSGHKWNAPFPSVIVIYANWADEKLAQKVFL